MLAIRVKPNQHPHVILLFCLPCGLKNHAPSQKKDSSYIIVLKPKRKQFVSIIFIKYESFLLELLKDWRTDVKMCGWVHLLR